MNRIFNLLICLACCTALSACAALKGQFEPGDAPFGSSASGSFPQLEAWLNRNMLSITVGQAGRIDYNRAFAQDSVIAYAESGSDDFSLDPARKRNSARQAAVLVAQRALAQFFDGHTANGQVRFMNYTVDLNTFLRAAVLVVDQYDTSAERAAVLLKLDLRRARGFAQ